MASADSDQATIVGAADEDRFSKYGDDEDERSSRQKSSIADGSEAGTAVAGEPPGLLGGVLPAVEVTSLMEKAKFYTSLCLGSTAILAVFAFLFAIPFVVEPSISTILADFSPRPVACATTSHVLAEGLKNCSWSSCREGCTAAVTSCHQIRVNYSRLTYQEFSAKPLGSIPWDVINTKFYVNAEGCGYPDTGVVCSVFAKKYGNVSHGRIFPCYYSRTYPETVVSKYSWDENLRNLILALTIPALLFVLSLVVLCYWYCPPVNKSCGGPSRNLIEKYDGKEDNLSEDNFEEDEEEY